MSKRDEAFELFSQGKVPTDSEVVALGLKVESAKRYYRQWEGAQPEPEVAAEVLVPRGVPVSSIPDGALFEYKGQLYTKRMIHRTGQVIADGMFRNRYPGIYKGTGESTWLPLDTVVTPI